MKRELTSILCATVLCGTASLAFAGAYGESVQPEEGPTPAPAAAVEAEPAPSGYWYLGAGALYSVENFHCDADDAWGYNVRGGRRFNDYVAAEIEWEHPVSDFDDANIVDGHGIPDGDVEVWNLTANAKAYPVHGRVQPYALVGAGYGEANLPHGDDNGGFIARFGIGLDFLFTDNFGADAEAGYVLGTGSLEDFDQVPISIGLFYNFL